MTLLLSLATPVTADTTLVIAGVEVPFVYVTPGAFDRDVEGGGTQHVTLTSGFWMAKHETTWAVWQAVMGWTDGRGQPTHPARRVSWNDVAEFMSRVHTELPGWTLRLPTEAEWEYAARAGTTSAWASGPDSLTLREHAWTRANANGAVMPVGGRAPNAWGLHDMHGNVWEWVSDWRAPYPDAASVTDPKGPAAGTERVRRGGSVVYGAQAARSSHRYQQPPERGNGNLGFRIVAVPTPTPGL